jgi:hypothetical protein
MSEKKKNKDSAMIINLLICEQFNNRWTEKYLKRITQNI